MKQKRFQSKQNVIVIIYFEIVHLIKEFRNINKIFEICFPIKDLEICHGNCSYQGDWLSGTCLCEVSVGFFLLLFICKLI